MASAAEAEKTRLVRHRIGHRRCEVCEKADPKIKETTQHAASFVNGAVRKANICDKCSTVRVFELKGDDGLTPTLATQYVLRPCAVCTKPTFHATVEQGKALETPRCVCCNPQPDDAVELQTPSKV